MAVTVTHTKTLVAPSTGAEDKVYGADYVSPTSHVVTGLFQSIPVACSDETTALTTGAAKVTFRIPTAMTLTTVKASLTTASTSGLVTVDVNRNGTSIFSTLLTFDVNEKTTATAAVPAVLAATALADDDEITIDIDVAGTGAKGLKVYLVGTPV